MNHPQKFVAQSIDEELEFEKRVVGASVTNPQFALSVSEFLTGEHFLDNDLGKAFDYITFVASKSAEPKLTRADFQMPEMQSIGGIKGAYQFSQMVIDAGFVIHEAQAVAEYKRYYSKRLKDAAADPNDNDFQERERSFRDGWLSAIDDASNAATDDLISWSDLHQQASYDRNKAKIAPDATQQEIDYFRGRHHCLGRIVEIAESVEDVNEQFKTFRRFANAGREFAASEDLTRPVPKVFDDDYEDTTEDLFNDYLDRLFRGDVQKLYTLPKPFHKLEIGPGLISVLGAGPGAGKTTFVMQTTFEALKHNPELHVTVANAEMSFDSIMRRELVRRTNISNRKLRFAELSKIEREDILHTAEELRPLLARMTWVKPPYDYQKLAGLTKKKPGLLVVDYLQKFVPDGEIRVGVNKVMTQLRLLALEGWAVVALSATSRINSKGGSSHDSSALTLASFKESGEIEFNADSAYLLRDRGPIDGTEWLREVELACVKNRHGDTDSVLLEFNKAGLRFSARKTSPPTSGPYDFGEYSNQSDDLEGYEDAF